MRALVTGAGGQLGRELVARLGDAVAWAGGHEELDVSDGAAVDAILGQVRPDVVFNAAAWNRVDAAEADPSAAFAANAAAPYLLARAASEAGALLVHVSTDYVFDGTSGRAYREQDPPRPLSVYGASKLAGEALVAASGAEHLVVRTSAVLGRGGSAQKGGSFVERIVARARTGQPLRVVTDQVFSPTSAPDLAEALLSLVTRGARGLVHVANAGSCTWHELAEAALEAAGVRTCVEPISSAELALAARRPAYSVLDTSRLAALGIAPLRHWREVLPDCLPAGG